mmetsp:Transcript_15078/g.38298  ORF Transcript_15078/g.38298 Transcript_15078/m.38298 type:complete len:269 (+) Transcript_15078:654-1460(+)
MPASLFCGVLWGKVGAWGQPMLRRMRPMRGGRGGSPKRRSLPGGRLCGGAAAAPGDAGAQRGGGAVPADQFPARVQEQVRHGGPHEGAGARREAALWGGRSAERRLVEGAGHSDGGRGPDRPPDRAGRNAQLDGGEDHRPGARIDGQPGAAAAQAEGGQARHRGGGARPGRAADGEGRQREDGGAPPPQRAAPEAPRDRQHDPAAARQHLRGHPAGGDVALAARLARAAGQVRGRSQEVLRDLRQCLRGARQGFLQGKRRPQPGRLGG